MGCRAIELEDGWSQNRMPRKIFDHKMNEVKEDWRNIHKELRHIRNTPPVNLITLPK
jgi:hypothetical protein